MSRKHVSFELIIILIALAIHGYVIFSPTNSLMNWYSSDDAFYYFKTAQNITEGKGITFDGFGRASGFHPLWMLVCIPVFTLANFNLFLPLRLLALISILLHAGCAALIFRTLKRVLSPAASILASALWLFSPLVHHTAAQMGMESGINAFFTLALLSRFSRCEIEQNWNRRRLLELGLLAALALFSRLDNVFLVFFMGLWMLLRRSLMRFLLLGDLILAAISALCSFYITVGFYESLRPYFPAAQVMVFVSVIVRPLVYFLFSLYGGTENKTPLPSWLRVCVAAVTASLTIGIIMLTALSAGFISAFPRSALLTDGILGLLAAIGLRWIFQRLSGKSGLLPKGKEGHPLDYFKQQLASWLSDGFWYALPAASILSLYLIWNKSYFGVLMPVSGQIKHWWGSIYTAYGRPVVSYKEFFGFPQDMRDSPWRMALSLPNSLAHSLRPLLRPLSLWNEGGIVAIVTAIMVILGLLILAERWPRNRRSLILMGLVPLAAVCAAQIIYYNGSNYVGLRSWYWTNHLIFTVLFTGLLLDGVIHFLSGWKVPQKMINGMVFSLVIYLMVNFTGMLIQLIPPKMKDLHAHAYLREIQLLEEAAEANTLIGMTGGGVVAYFIKDRTVVNLDGLMNTAEYFQLMRSGRAQEYLNHIGLDYVYGNAYIITSSEPFEKIFAERVELLDEFEGGTLFHYIPTP